MRTGVTRATSGDAVAWILLLVAALLPQELAAQAVYVNDFESGSLAGWSTNVSNPAFQRPIGISRTPTGRSFLGEFGSQSIALFLPTLPRHDSVLVELDLFVIRSWDGDGSTIDAPDVMTISPSGASELLRTTFSNNPGLRQSFPGSYPGPSNLAWSGASEIRRLGYGTDGDDAVYHLRFAFPHTERQLTLTLAALLRDRFPTIANESWGIDNVAIAVTPAGPASATLSVVGASAQVGDPVEIGIRMHDRVAVDAAGITDVRVRMRFNASMLLPMAQTPRGTIVGDERVIDLELPVVSFGDSLIARLLFRAALGSDTATDIILEQARGVQDTMSLTMVDGRFQLLGLCSAGGLRLFQPGAATTLKPPRPAPASRTARVEIELGIDSQVLLRVADIHGRTVELLHAGPLETGSHAFDVDVSQLASGRYLVVAEVDGDVWQEWLLVLR